ncbi:MAG: DUF1573 domain-containing protein [Runella sp.]
MLYVIVFLINCCIVVYWSRYREYDKINNLTEIAIEPTQLFIGKTKWGNTSVANYTIKNIGTTPLFIKNIKADCHCTVVEWEKKTIKPFESTKIQIKYDNHMTGYFKRVILLEANILNNVAVFTFEGETVKK